MTKITTVSAATVAAAGAIGIFSAPIAVADPSTQTLGSQGKLEDGAVVQGWTIDNLRPSTDTIPYPVNGTLWEATANDQAIQGSVTPIVSNLNARAQNGQTYRALFGVATPQGVNPATLAQGQQTTGKVYFDVTGEEPQSVVYNAGGQDLLVWLQPPPSSTPTSTPSRSYPTESYPSGSGATAAAPAATPATPAPGATPASPAAPAPAETPATPLAVPPGSQGTPLPPGSQGTPLPVGSQGTPLPPGSQGTPLPVGSQGTPLPPGSQGAPLPAGSQGTPLPPGSQGAPLPPAEGAPLPPAEGGAPLPASADMAPLPAGSQGTPLPPGGEEVPTPTTYTPAPTP